MRHVIDAHLHLDEKIDGGIAKVVKSLDDDLAASGIEKGLILHLSIQKWNREEIIQEVNKSSRLEAFVNLHPYEADCKSLLPKYLEMGYCGLKLHPRLENYDIADPRVADLIREAGKLNVPVLIDAFPDGTIIHRGFVPAQYAELARQCPDTKIIWAHMGGHYVLDFMMLAKRLPNVFLDFSYSLLYYQGSSVPRDIVYAMKSMRYQKIFYGSDYPDRSIKATLDGSLEFLEREGVTGEALERVMYYNAKEFFNW